MYSEPLARYAKIGPNYLARAPRHPFSTMINRPGRPLSILPKPATVKTGAQAKTYWGNEASTRIKRGMNARNWGYKELTDALRAQGFVSCTTAIKRRIHRGNFAAGLFLACLYVLENSSDVSPTSRPE